jgi:hypothetical protein
MVHAILGVRAAADKPMAARIPTVAWTIEPEQAKH